MSQQTPAIFVFCLGGPLQQAILRDVFGRLMNTIAQKAVLKQAGTTREALDLLYGDIKPKAIIVADSDITTARNAIVSEMVVEFARNGGIVVLGGLFSSSIRPSDLRGYFNKKWNLPWRDGSYYGTIVALNQNAKGIPGDKLPSSYSQKALFLANVNNNAAWYLPTEDSDEDSLISAPEPVATPETPVAFTQVGSGWLGYIGDVNGEEGTDAVVLEMLGLL